MNLSGNHPGFHDRDYRHRRDSIAAAANAYVSGERIPHIEYVDVEHKVWEHILNELKASHENFACRRFLDCKDRFSLPEKRLPQLSEVSDQLMFFTGYGIEPVPGLVSPRRFLEGLGEKKLLSTQYIRHHSVPEYTPEPDIVHEVIGHALFLSDLEYAEMNSLFGKVATLSPEEEIEQLISLYWHTLEFGICLEEGRVKAYGAGLLSSIDEMRTIDSVPRRQFNIGEMQSTKYDTEHVQPHLFCAESFDAAMCSLTEFLVSRLEAISDDI